MDFFGIISKIKIKETIPQRGDGKCFFWSMLYFLKSILSTFPQKEYEEFTPNYYKNQIIKKISGNTAQNVIEMFQWLITENMKFEDKQIIKFIKGILPNTKFRLPQQIDEYCRSFELLDYTERDTDKLMLFLSFLTEIPMMCINWDSNKKISSLSIIDKNHYTIVSNNLIAMEEIYITDKTLTFEEIDRIIPFIGNICFNNYNNQHFDISTFDYIETWEMLGISHEEYTESIKLEEKIEEQCKIKKEMAEFDIKTEKEYYEMLDALRKLKSK